MSITGTVKNLPNLVEELEREVAERTVDVVKKAFSLIVIGTPVDTGRARGSWSINYDGMIYDVFTGAEPPRNVETAAFAGRVFITNGTTYIQFLNEGHSPQADPMYIEEILTRLGIPGLIEVIPNAGPASFAGAIA